MVDMKNELNGKVAVVTGSARNIGGLLQRNWHPQVHHS